MSDFESCKRCKIKDFCRSLPDDLSCEDVQNAARVDGLLDDKEDADC